MILNQVNDYVKNYIGEGKGPKNFAKEYLERRSKYKNSLKVNNQNFEDELLTPAQAINPNREPETNDGWINDDTPHNVTILPLCCRTLFVSLSGKAKDNQSCHAGEYNLQTQGTNSFLSWKHVNENTSIWYDCKNGIWRIGHTKNCGSDICTLFIKSQDSCPHKIKGVWTVWYVADYISNDGWLNDDTPNNVKVGELCCKILVVTLSGMAEEHLNSCEGEYILQSLDINSYMSWKHVCIVST